MIEAKRIIEYLKSKKADFEYFGKENIIIDQISNLQEIHDNSICWFSSRKYASEMVISEIRGMMNVIVVSPFEIEGLNCIVTTYPKGVFFDILNHFFAEEKKHFVSEKATVLTRHIGENVHIGANSYIDENVVIGNNTIIHTNVSITCPCTIGHDCEIYPGVVIGTDGFGYYYEGDVPYKENHFMGVKIGDYVDVGANTCIDRGLITDTIIGNHTKIDALCRIGHNVVVEENCLIIAGTIICGSARIKRNSYLAPSSVVLNQVSLGEGSKVGVNSVAMADVEDGTTIMGTPGIEFLPKIIKKRKEDNRE